jgi:predicted Zn finger-like uncharacterized protein
MALATRCPRCASVFRVATDQLKLRGGMVRCGDCRYVFDATATLDYLEHMRPGRDGDGEASPPTLREPAIPGAGRERAGGGGARNGEGDGKVATGAAAHAGSPGEAGTDAAAAAQGDAGAFEPEFLRAGVEGPLATRLRLAAVVLLALALPLELAFSWRTGLIAQFPSLRAGASAACAALGCEIPWPRRPEQLAIVGSEMQSLPGTDVIELTAVLRNRADFALAMPALEVTLADSFNHPVVRRVFPPREISVTTSDPPVPAGASIPAGADLPLRVAVDAPGIAAMSYVVYPFYP